MSDFESSVSWEGFAVKAWRGERMCLIGFDVREPEPDFVGFAIECRSPRAKTFVPLRNRLAFAYDKPAVRAVTGSRQFPSTQAPFQKYRWVHFPHEPQAGNYAYRVTRMHMPRDGQLAAGQSLDVEVSLDPVTYEGFLDIGFTRNFASSQAYVERFGNATDIIPDTADEGLAFAKKSNEVYRWLGFEAHDLLFTLLDEAVNDQTTQVDVFAYDLNEPDVVSRLERLGPRLRAIIDDSSTKKGGVTKGHGAENSAESEAARRLQASAGAARVKRLHFAGLQHHKVIVVRRDGQPIKVLAGSTNFSFRGLYIQANNILVFQEPVVAELFGRAFDLAFDDAASFEQNPLSRRWHVVDVPNRPRVQVCFAPHASTDVSLNPVRGAVDQASSAVLYSIAFLNQIKSGPTRQAFDRLVERPVFSYGVVDEKGGLAVKKPDGSTGLVDFAFLAANAPPPFSAEWSGGKGINIHHKFVVTDFNLPSAKVFTGSSNLSPSGEGQNGDHLIMIEDRKVAVAYAVEALRIFDHLQFRSRLNDKAKGLSRSDRLALQKPVAGRKAWFEKYYAAGSQRERDRLLFSH